MALILDTLLYTQRLQRVGFSREQAEAHAEITRDLVLAEVASRDDVKAEIAQLRSEITAFEQRLLYRITVLIPAVLIGTVTLVSGIFGLYYHFIGK